MSKKSGFYGDAVFQIVGDEELVQLYVEKKRRGEKNLFMRAMYLWVRGVGGCGCGVYGCAACGAAY